MNQKLFMFSLKMLSQCNFKEIYIKLYIFFKKRLIAEGKPFKFEEELIMNEMFDKNSNQ